MNLLVSLKIGASRRAVRRVRLRNCGRPNSFAATAFRRCRFAASVRRGRNGSRQDCAGRADRALCHALVSGRGAERGAKIGAEAFNRLREHATESSANVADYCETISAPQVYPSGVTGVTGEVGDDDSSNRHDSGPTGPSGVVGPSGHDGDDDHRGPGRNPRPDRDEDDTPAPPAPTTPPAPTGPTGIEGSSGIWYPFPAPYTPEGPSGPSGSY